MSIYSDFPREAEDAADAFLGCFGQAQAAIRKAMIAAHRCAQLANPAHQPRYDQLHKKMVRQVRCWNDLEHARCRPAEPDNLVPLLDLTEPQILAEWEFMGNQVPRAGETLELWVSRAGLVDFARRIIRETKGASA